MTKKDYKLIAEVLQQQESDIRCYSWSVNHNLDFIMENIVKSLCDAFKKNNSKFDIRKFKSAVFGIGKSYE